MDPTNATGLSNRPLALTGSPEPCVAPQVVVIRQLVFQLNALCKARTLDFALSVGRTVIGTMYAGDIDRFRSRARKHNIALRSLATHPDLAMSPSMLYDCLAMYELCERMGIRSWNHVSTSHLRLVLPLEKDQQSRLLRAAEAGRWPVRRLEQEVEAFTTSHPPTTKRGGRRRHTRLRKWISAFEKSLELLPSLLRSGDSQAEPSPESVRGAAKVLQRAGALGKLLEEQSSK